MYKIIIFSDSFKYLENPIKEYEKRLGNNIEIIKLKPSKKSQENEIIKEETQILYEKLEKVKGFKILLCIDGEKFSTKNFYDLIEKNKQNFSDIIFIIGGAYGIDIKKIDNLINLKLSISLMTFPHLIVLLILLEQIYRIEMIKKGTGYHH